MTGERRQTTTTKTLAKPLTIGGLLDRNDVLIFDTETTGFLRWSEIVEISIIDTTGRVRLNTVVMPRRKISEDVVAVHGLTKDRLIELDAPSWGDVLNQVQAVLAEAEVLAAYNADFDLRMIEQTNNIHRTFFSADFAMPATCCILREYEKSVYVHDLDATAMSKKLAAAHKALTGSEPSECHRSLSDCMSTLAVMRAIAERYREARDPGHVSLTVERRFRVPDETRPVRGKRFVITGQFAEMSRSRMTGLICHCGGKVANAVSRLTDYLVRGSNCGNGKTKDATALGVQIIDISDLLRMLDASEIMEYAPIRPGMVRDGLDRLPAPAAPAEPKPVSHRGISLSGKSFVITGTLPEVSHAEAAQLIAAYGGRVSTAISAKTDYLIAGEKPGSKLAKARALGTPVMDIDDLFQMIGPAE